MLFEVGIRFVFPDSEAVSDKEFDANKGWRNKPGLYSEKPDYSFTPHDIHINKYGLRSETSSSNQTIPQNQIVVLGDSFTFARAVGYDEIFTSILERIINEQASDQFKVINAGVEGFGTAQQLHQLRELQNYNIVGQIYILQLFSNDIMDNLRLDYTSLEIQTLQPGYSVDVNGILTLKYPPVETNPEQKTSNSNRTKTKGFRTIKVLRSAAESFVQSRPLLISMARNLGISVAVPRMPGLINAWYSDDILKKGLPLTERLIDQIRTEVNQLGADLLLVFIPSPLTVYPDTYGPLLKSTFPNSTKIDEFIKDPARSQREYQKLAEKLNITYLDLYPVLLENNSKSLYIPREGHLSGQGHEVVARTIAKKLETMHIN